MKHFISYLLGAAILVALLLLAINVHDQTSQHKQQSAANAAETLRIVKEVDAKNLSDAQDAATKQKTTLCSFIKTNTKAGVALPAACQ